MKQKFTYILILLCVVLLNGCEYRKEQSPSPEEITVETSKKIMEALQQNDKQMLAELFCPYIRETYPQLDEEIDNLYNVINGEIMSYDEPSPSLLGGATKEGEGWVQQYTVAKIVNVKTNNNEEYTIRYKYYFIDKERPTYEGMVCISITKENNQNLNTVEDENYEIEFPEMWE